MKKSLLKKTMLLLCALVVGSTSSWAATAGFSLASNAAVPLSAGDTKTTTIAGTASETWSVSITGTWSSSSLQGTAGAKYWQMGKKDAPITSATFSTSGISGTITSVVVNCASYSSKTVVNCTVGGSNFGTQGQATAAWASNTGGNITFSGSASGAIVVTLDNSADGARAVYIQSITVTYSTGGGSSDPSISLGNTSVNTTAASTDGTINVTYNNITTVDSEVKFYESDGTTETTYSWIDADIDGENNIYYLIDANTGAERTAYMKVHQKNTEVYSSLITITQEAYNPVAVTLDFTTNSWGISEKPTKTVDATEFTSGGYTITLKGSSGNGYYFDTNNIMLGKLGATLTLPAFGFNVSKIKVYGASGASSSVTFNVFVGDDAVSTGVTNSTEDHEFAIAAEKQAVGTIYTIKVTNANNMRISKIEIYGNGCEAGIVTDAGWATYVTDCDMEFVEGDAFVVSAANATTATLTGVTKIRANQPVLLKGEGAKTAKVLDETPAAVSNELAISIGGSIDGFVLAKPAGKSAGFYKWNGGSLTSGKVYLPAPTAARDYLEFSFGGETTSISEIETMRNVGNETFYNLNGQKVQNPTKGLYIVNGKKVIIK